MARLDHDALARGFLRHLRGTRSQIAFSRRLGYSTNVAYAWESGRRAPTAAEALRAASRVGVDVRRAVAGFFQRNLPSELHAIDPTSPAFVVALLAAARGPGPIGALATRAGLGRSAVSRILSGTSQPRLAVFFRLVDAMTRRLLDLLGGFVDVATLPGAEEEWARLEALRRLARDNPLSEAVPRFLELEQYAALPRHRRGWIAKRLGVSIEAEERTLADLARAGITHWDGARWQLDKSRSVDTSRDPETAVRLRGHWTEEARKRIVAGREREFSYLVFGVDDATLASMQELRARYFRELRAMVRTSKSSTRVAVANAHLFTIDDG